MDNAVYGMYPFTVYTYDRVDSTNSVAMRAVKHSKEQMHFSVHVAGEQTDGRGRNDRKWINTEDSVMMSIVVKTRLAMEKIPMLNLAAAVAVKNAVMKLTRNGMRLSVKWPNDVITSDSYEKVCGILSETMRLDNAKYAIIGIGLNLNARTMPDDLLQPATSVYLHYGKYIDVLKAVDEILKQFKLQYEYLMKDPNGFLKGFAEDCITLGHHVSVDDGKSIRYGMGERLAPNGQLIVRFEGGVSDVVYSGDVSIRNMRTIDRALAKKLMPKPKPFANKGAFGKAAMIVGSPDMPGAALMSTKACIRAGAGLTRALIPEEIKASFAAVPEAMLVTDCNKADELIEWADSICIGCGMGVSERTRALLDKVLKSGKKCVIDADALNTMSKHRELLELLHENTVITPHPGEMGRLMECETERAAADLTSCAKEFALKYGCNVLMKSHYSAVVSPAGVIRYNDSGNEALAKGGSGDVLAGLIAGLMAQKVKPFDAASLGAYLLGVSAEEVICFLRNRFAGATDIIDVISTEIQ